MGFVSEGKETKSARSALAFFVGRFVCDGGCTGDGEAKAETMATLVGALTRSWRRLVSDALTASSMDMATMRLTKAGISFHA